MERRRRDYHARPRPRRRILIDLDANRFFVIADFDDLEELDRAGAVALAAALEVLDLVADADEVAA